MPCLRCLTTAGPAQSAAHAGIAVSFCNQCIGATVGGSAIRSATGAPSRRGRLVPRPFTALTDAMQSFRSKRGTRPHPAQNGRRCDAKCCVAPGIAVFSAAPIFVLAALSDPGHPLIKETSILPCADMICVFEPARKNEVLERAAATFESRQNDTAGELKELELSRSVALLNDDRT